MKFRALDFKLGIAWPFLSESQRYGLGQAIKLEQWRLSFGEGFVDSVLEHYRTTADSLDQSYRWALGTYKWPDA